jgi:diacylglycerol kinase family enzyme
MHGSVHLFDHLPQIVRPKAAAAGAAAPSRQVPLVGVIRNLRSHRKDGDLPDWTGRATLLVETPRKRTELIEILSRFAERRVDYIVIAGGDGTVRDVLTCGAGIFGDSWPPLVVLPNGKTNALAVDLRVPAKWALREALEALRSGRIVHRRALVVAQRDNPDARVQGFVFGAGAYTASIGLGQQAHDKGAFQNLGVGITVVWSLLQALFGGPRNLWRRGTPMRLADARGGEIPHSGVGPVDERYLVFASTLDRFPAGLRPFAEAAGPLRVAVLDNSSRGLLLRLPLIFRGKVSERMRRLGYNVVTDESLEIDLSGRFILDGEAFPAGRYHLSLGPKLRFVVP